MSQKIDLDHGRFRQIIRGKIKQNLRKYISQGEMIAKKGKDTVAIPIPSVDTFAPTPSLGRVSCPKEEYGNAAAAQKTRAGIQDDRGLMILLLAV